MKLYKDSKIAGTNFAGIPVREASFIFLNEVDCKLKLVQDNDDSAITSVVQDCYQSAENTLLFITKSGSRYAIEFQEENGDFHSEFAKILRVVMERRFTALKYCDLGKRIIEECNLVVS